MNKKRLFIFLTALFLFSANLFIFLINCNSRFDSRNWRIEKDELAYFVMGSRSFGASNYLKNGALELSAFFGFNQIELKNGESDCLGYSRVSFDFMLGEEKSYLLFLFKKSSQGCYALRLSGSGEKDNCFIFYSGSLEKKEKTAINYPALTLNSWHRAEIEFLPNNFRLYIDGSYVCDMANRAGLQAGNIGFKCGFGKVFIDNLAIRGRNSGQEAEYFFSEKFSPGLPATLLSLVAVFISLFYHFAMYFIFLFICHSLFGLRAKEAWEIFISALGALILVSLISLLLQLVIQAGQYNILSLFYFGEIKLPSLRPVYIYESFFIITLLFKIRKLTPKASLDRLRRLSLAAFFIFSALGIYFISQGSLFYLLRLKPDISGYPVNLEERIVKYPLTLKLPEKDEYELNTVLKLANPGDKLLLITRGAKFIITAEQKSSCGFEPDGSPGDFLFDSARPIKSLPLAPGKDYHFRLVKTGNCMSAFIEGALVDAKLVKRGTSSEFLNSVMVLFPFKGDIFLKQISIDRISIRSPRLYLPLAKEILRQLFFFLFFIACFILIDRIAGKKTGWDFWRKACLFNLLLGQLLLYFFFKDLLANDPFFSFFLLASYVSILMFVAYQNRQKLMIMLLCVPVAVYSIFLFSIKPRVIFDLSQAAFSGYWSSMNNFVRPPQQLEAFIYNNNFDESYLDDFSAKTKVLMLGSSQTWGAGASGKDKTTCAYLEGLLNSNGKKNIKVINCGINGSHSSYLGNFFDSFLIKLRPKLIIINLSNNDFFFWKHSIFRQQKGKHARFSDAQINRVVRQDFKTSLIEKFIKPCIANDIRILFVEEPNSPENKLREETLGEMQKVIRELSLTYGIPVAKVNRDLDLYDADSPIWWDFMHLSSLGQERFARLIYECIQRQKLLS